ncbi:unnamed protein product [Ectocarpus sp. 8 AP-2014]
MVTAMCLWDATAELSDMPMGGSTSGVGEYDDSNSTRLQKAQRTRPETAVTARNTGAEAFEAHVRPAQNQELDNTIKLNETLGRPSNEMQLAQAVIQPPIRFSKK